MSQVLKVLFTVLFALYPFIIYFGLNQFEFWQIAAVLAGLALIRIFWLHKQRRTSHPQKTFDFNSGTIMSACLLLVFAALTVFTDHALWLKLYPVVVSLTLFITFAASLKTQKCVIQRLAEIREKNITAEKQRYMVNLTKVWCGFFVLNMMLSLLTLYYASLATWTLYNGLISYLLMGSLFVGELAYRHWVVIPKTL